MQTTAKTFSFSVQIKAHRLMQPLHQPCSLYMSTVLKSSLPKDITVTLPKQSQTDFLFTINSWPNIDTFKASSENSPFPTAYAYLPLLPPRDYCCFNFSRGCWLHATKHVWIIIFFIIFFLTVMAMLVHNWTSLCVSSTVGNLVLRVLFPQCWVQIYGYQQPCCQSSTALVFLEVLCCISCQKGLGMAVDMVPSFQYGQSATIVCHEFWWQCVFLF